jgi:hypothetical protein
MEENKPDIKERSFKFAVRIIKFVQKFPRNYVTQKIGGQLLDAGTSVEQMLRKPLEGLARKTLLTRWELPLRRRKNRITG